MAIGEQREDRLTAPAPARRCPIIDLLELIASFLASSPNANSRRRFPTGLARVEVPCA